MSTSDHLDLRGFLAAVRDRGPGHYRQISRTVSPRWTTTGIVTALAKRLRAPVLEFLDVEGSSFPMVTNACASVDRVAKSAGMSADDLNRRLIAALDDPIEPVVVPRGGAPVAEVEQSFDECSLPDLPQLIYSETQEAAYITSSLVIGVDPDSGAHNLSFNRLMISGNDTALIYMTPGGHLDQIWQKNRKRGRRTPLAAAIGTHPLWCYATLVAGGLEREDYDTVGAVLGEPLQITPSRTTPDLHVPARAEIVLEGFIEPAETEVEGPFGEFLGYVAEEAPRPVVRFTRLTSRRSPIYQDIVAGQVEHMTMSSVSLRARLERDYFRHEPAILDFWLPAPMTIFLSVDSDAYPDYDAPAIMDRLLQEQAYLKYAYAFDEDVELRKLSSVQTALACFAQPARDFLVSPDRDGNGVDPSERDGRTSKVAVDARARQAMTRSELPTGLVEGLDLSEWLE